MLPTTRVYSFGVQENTSPETKQVTGHSLSLALWNKDGPTDEEKAWTDTFNNIVERCKKYIVDNKEELEQYELSMNDLKKFNPFWWKRDKKNPDVKKRNNIVEGTGPTLCPKLIFSKKHNKMLSMLYDPEGNEIDYLTMIKQPCYVTALVKVESIFIGSKVISLQVKLYEATIERLESMMKPLMKRTIAPTKLIKGDASNMNEMKDDEDQDSLPSVMKSAGLNKPVARSGSLDGADNDVVVDTDVVEGDDNNTAPPAVPVRPPVRKIAKKITAKAR